MNFSTVNWLELLTFPVLAGGAAAFWYGTQIEPKKYMLESIDITVSGAKAATKNKIIKILHISDLHLCYPESHKIEFLKIINEDHYDLVLLTGDVFENLSGLLYSKLLLTQVPKLGAYAVLGNHDCYNYNMINKTLGRIVRRLRHPKKMRDVGPIVDALERSNFKVLRNEKVKLSDAGIEIIGIDYPGIDVSDLNNLVNNSSQDMLKLVLFHMPVNLSTISNTNVHLAFGGHTHGGQIRIPGVGAIITDSELPGSKASGLMTKGNTIFHISRGLGADPRSNIRIFCPPAATVVNVTVTG